MITEKSGQSSDLNSSYIVFAVRHGDINGWLDEFMYI